MKQAICVRWVALILGGLLLCSAPASAQELAGSYQVKGAGPEGTMYLDSATITQTGKTYHMVWGSGSGSYSGTGLLHEGVFAVAYNGGLAVYSVQSDGTLKGVWTLDGSELVGTETLIPQ